jgi:endonuclease/exonuclease/phosphatase (EEP) superfamily protein YafD
MATAVAPFARAAGWAVSGALAALFLAQRTGLSDHHQSLVIAAVLTPVIFLPAWVVAGLAMAGRRWRLAAAAGLVVAGHLSLLWPVLPVHGAAVPQGPELRVVTANLLWDNADPLGAVRAVLAQDGDVLAVEEYTDAYRRLFDQEGVGARYPYRIEAMGGGPEGTALFSRFPLSGAEPLRIGHHAVQASVSVDGVKVTILAVHPPAPWQANLGTWKRSMEAIHDRAETVDGPLVVAGDFNATPYHSAFRQMLDGPLDDAAERLGDAWHLATWRDHGRLPPMAMIDHVLTTPGISPTDLSTVTTPGSDHRMVVVTLRLAATE